MNRVIIPLVLIAGVMSGCATTKDSTLASLGEKLDIKIERNAVIASARQKAMDNYWDFMNSAPEDSLRVEAMRRLADLELEKSEELVQRQIEQLDQQDSEMSSGVDVGNIKITGTNFDKAIQLYRQALSVSKKKFGVEDKKALYQISKAYEQMGANEKALDALDRLLTQHPDIDNRDEIYFRRGEMLFALKKFKLAELAYTQAMVVNPSSIFYEKALSQKSWSLYKQGLYEKGLSSFFSIVDRKLRGASGVISNAETHLSSGEKELLRDIFRAIVLSFNEIGGADAVAKHFTKHGSRPYESRVYKAIGKHYLNQERIKDSADAYKSFVRKYPEHERAPEFDLYAIKAYSAGGFAGLVIKGKMDFAQKYRIGDDYWMKQSNAAHEKILPLVAKNMEELASHYHAQAQKTKKQKDYTRAILWYRNYIKTFPKTKKSAELNFLLAETLYENKRYEFAIKEYEKTAYQYVKGGKNVEAGYAALVAYGVRAKLFKGRQREVLERLSIGSALRFGKAFPEDPRAASVVTKASEDLFALKKFDQAAVAARAILEMTKNITAEMRRTAWLIVAQAEFQNQKYTRAEAAYKIALAMTKDVTMRGTIVDSLAATLYKRGEQLREKGDDKGALAQFAKIRKVAPNSDINISADFDIAVNFMRQKNWSKAIKELLSFRSRNPAHEFRNQVTENLTHAYLKLDKPFEAAREMRTMMYAQTDPKVKRDLQWQLTQLYEKTGLKEEIKESYKEYIQKYPKPMEQSMEARQKLADIYEKNRDVRKQYYWLKQIVYHVNNATAGGSERTNYLAAKASFILAAPQLDKYNDVKLVAPLKKNLKKKKKLMKDAVDAFTVAANYGVAEVTTASTYTLAEIYNSFGRELMDSEKPKGLSSDELEQYDILLEEQAYPFEEKSIDIHETNAQRIVDGTYDDWVKKSLKALSSLRPARYMKSEKSELVANDIL